MEKKEPTKRGQIFNMASVGFRYYDPLESTTNQSLYLPKRIDFQQYDDQGNDRQGILKILGGQIIFGSGADISVIPHKAYFPPTLYLTIKDSGIIYYRDSGKTYDIVACFEYQNRVTDTDLFVYKIQDQFLNQPIKLGTNGYFIVDIKYIRPINIDDVLNPNEIASFDSTALYFGQYCTMYLGQYNLTFEII